MSHSLSAVDRVLQGVTTTRAQAVFLDIDEAALRRAQMCANSHGPLAGMGVVIKDNIDIKGHPTTAGSRSFDVPIAKQSAPLVEQIMAAGGVPIGHANMSEFAFSGLGVNPHFGTPMNGLDSALVPGGSSSGCASAIALGLADVAVGTDTSGSTRVPAAYQGIVGFRPTMTRYENGGVFPLAPSLDTLGPMAKNMHYLNTLDDVMTGVTRNYTATPTELIVPCDGDLGTLDDEIRTMFHHAILIAKETGVQVTSREIGVFKDLRALFAKHGTLVGAEAPSCLAQYTALDNPLIDPNIRSRLAQCAEMTDEQSLALYRARPLLQAQLRRELKGALVILPTVPVPPPRLATVLRNPAAFAAANAKALSLTMLGSYLDMPSLSLPCGRKPGHSITLAGHSGRDNQVLELATLLEPFLLNQKG